MPRNPNRLRHGMGHSRLPSTAVVSGSGATPSQSKPKATPTAPKAKRSQIVPVTILDAFYQMLPSPNVQQMALVREAEFDTSDLDNGMSIGQIVTPRSEVYVWTDIIFYGLMPGNGLASPMHVLSSYQLSGLVRFIFEIDNKSPMNLQTDTFSPYIHPSRWPSQGGQAGWNVMDQVFGTSRGGTSFALYAHSGQISSVRLQTVQRGRYPRFRLTSIGFQLHGFTVPAGEFDSVWRKHSGEKR